MPFRPADETPVLRDGIASLPEMEDIQLELPLSCRTGRDIEGDAGLKQSRSSPSTKVPAVCVDRHR